MLRKSVINLKFVQCNINRFKKKKALVPHHSHPTSHHLHLPFNTFHTHSPLSHSSSSQNIIHLVNIFLMEQYFNSYCHLPTNTLPSYDTFLPPSPSLHLFILSLSLSLSPRPHSSPQDISLLSFVIVFEEARRWFSRGDA